MMRGMTFETPSPDEMLSLLEPFHNDLQVVYIQQLIAYLELLLRWNAKTNLTSIRDPREIVRRHFGESLFAARHLPPCSTLLDLGSGAGFPGLPIAIVRPEIKVTLAESQNKKSTFLREAVRTLALTTEVWAARVETMPTDRRFDVVTLRAVDRPDEALKLAADRVAPGGSTLHLTTSRMIRENMIHIPGTEQGVLSIDQIVPRGTIST